MRTRAPRLTLLLAAIGSLGALAGCRTGDDADFIPGELVEVEILGAEVPETGEPTITFRVTDEDGEPVTDLEQEIRNEESGDDPLPEPRMRPRFSLAQLEDDRTFTHYYEVERAGAEFDGEQPALASALQPRTEPAGPSFPFDRLDQSRASEGIYTYTFSEPTTPEAKRERSRIHRVGLWTTRTTGGRASSVSRTFDFRPTGGDAQVVESVTNAACARCHTGGISAHDNRRDVRLCVTCHASDRDDEYLDPETGENLSSRVMFHRIHRGADLPSVREGRPLRIVGFRQSVHDFSHLEFPSGVANCTACHEGPNAARWQTAPGLEVCTSCHDNVAFDGSAPGTCSSGDTGRCNHRAGPLPAVERCGSCHGPEAIAAAHGR